MKTDIVLRKKLRDFIVWQKQHNLLKDTLTIDYELADTYLEELSASSPTNMKTESQLAILAETHPDDDIALQYMKELRKRFDETYIWCQDCDGLVCKEEDCCLNKDPLEESSDDDLDELFKD